MFLIKCLVLGFYWECVSWNEKIWIEVNWVIVCKGECFKVEVLVGLKVLSKVFERVDIVEILKEE